MSADARFIKRNKRRAVPTPTRNSPSGGFPGPVEPSRAAARGLRRSGVLVSRNILWEACLFVAAHRERDRRRTLCSAQQFLISSSQSEQEEADRAAEEQEAGRGRSAKVLGIWVRSTGSHLLPALAREDPELITPLAGATQTPSK